MEKINIRGVNFLNTTLDGAAEYIWQRFADGEQTAVLDRRYLRPIPRSCRTASIRPSFTKP